MRPIKFRAWSAKNLYMHYDIGVFVDQCCGVAKDLPVMQFTGLLDKNGTEIYEGDILRYQTSPAYVVVFERCRFALKCSSADGTSVMWIVDKTDFMEVVGNIYENPELLK